MSKRKSDETQARSTRKRKPLEPSPALPATLRGPFAEQAPQEAQETAATDDATKKASRKGRAAHAAPVATTEATEGEDELCVFAFRLKPEERDAIHRAAGAAKASKFARALLVAAARGDEDLVQQIVRATKESAA